MLSASAPTRYNRRRPLIVAAIVSLLLHSALFVGLRREMPAPPEPTSHVLEARLLPMPPSPIVEEVIKPSPKVVQKPIKPRKKPVLAKPDVTLPVPQQAPVNMEAPPPGAIGNIPPTPSASSVEALPIPGPAPAAEESTSQASPLPSRLLIRFAVYLGGLKAGEAEYRWEQSGGRYDLQSFVKT